MKTKSTREISAEYAEMIAQLLNSFDHEHYVKALIREAILLDRKHAVKRKRSRK